MKLRKTIIFAAISGLAISAASAVNIQINLGANRDSGNGGGEFLISSTSDPAWVAGVATNYAGVAKVGSSAFATFCIQMDEHFSPGSTYESQVSGAALGPSSTDPFNPVSVGTAYLYSLFAKGDLASAVAGYSYGNDSSAGDLQETIWWLEGDPMANPGTFDSLLTAKFGSNMAVWNDDSWNGLFAADFGVQALNLGLVNANPQSWASQDQLVFNGGGSQNVPDGGATLVLLGLAIGGVRLLKRKLD